MKDAVSKELGDLYRDYYSDGSLQVKRAIAASDSVDHIQALAGGNLGKLLDVGAGNGSVLKEIAGRHLASEMYALEISASGLERIGELDLPNMKEVRMFDGYSIPYPDVSFDSAICIHVVEHVEHERMLLREIARVAKNIFIEVPLEGGVRGRINYEYGHINYYTPLSIKALIETSGLEIVSYQVVTSSLAYEQLLYGRKKGSIRNYARKALLRLLGNNASQLLTYLFSVHCRPRASESKRAPIIASETDASLAGAGD